MHCLQLWQLAAVVPPTVAQWAQCPCYQDQFGGHISGCTAAHPAQVATTQHLCFISTLYLHRFCFVPRHQSGHVPRCTSSMPLLSEGRIACSGCNNIVMLCIVTCHVSRVPRINMTFPHSSANNHPVIVRGRWDILFILILQ